MQDLDFPEHKDTPLPTTIFGFWPNVKKGGSYPAPSIAGFSFPVLYCITPSIFGEVQEPHLILVEKGCAECALRNIVQLTFFIRQTGGASH